MDYVPPVAILTIYVVLNIITKLRPPQRKKTE